MKRLFAIKTPEGLVYFDRKQDAKTARDMYPGTRVMRGPDHKRGGTYHGSSS